VFAAALPFIGGGEQVLVAGRSLSVEGLWSAWNIAAKATLGVTATVVVAATTPVSSILGGLDRLRMPRTLTAIAGFMVRYLEVTSAEAQRMTIARQARGHDPRWIWQARAVAATAGTLFIRAYERGERVHLAMAARGFDGTMPDTAVPAATRRAWATALAMPLAAASVGLVATVSLR